MHKSKQVRKAHEAYAAYEAWKPAQKSQADQTDKIEQETGQTILATLEGVEAELPKPKQTKAVPPVSAGTPSAYTGVDWAQSWLNNGNANKNRNEVQQKKAPSNIPK